MIKLSQSFRDPTYDKAFSSNSVVKNLNFVDTESASVPVSRTFSCTNSEVLRAVDMKCTISWNVPPRSFVEVCRRFRGTYCLHHRNRIVRRPEYMAPHPSTLILIALTL
jgi:hypothetical protein